jgi:hypothetical protein
MSTGIDDRALTFRVDRKALMAIADERREAYASATPYAHTVMDDFLPEDVLENVLREFPDPNAGKWHQFESALEKKLASNDERTMGPATRHLLAELNSGTFIDFLERLTGIEGLVPDPHLVGGGLHQIVPGGHLKVHADFNKHPRLGLERRLNVLVYLNQDWQDEWGGAFELWKQDMSACEKKVLPYWNRCVVFSTTSTSYHGHPEPLACPEDRTRKSLALYYYTKDRPRSERGRAHNTRFQSRPGEELPSLPLKERIKPVLRTRAPGLLRAWQRLRS